MVSLNAVSLSSLHGAKVFKELNPTPPRTVTRYGQATVPVIIKSPIDSDLDLLARVDLESPLILDFFINSTIFDPFAMNAYISFPVSNPGKTHK